MADQVTIVGAQQRFKKTPAGEIPVDWEASSVGSLARELVNGGTPDTKIEAYWRGDIPWITGADFSKQKVAAARRTITQEAVRSSATNILPKGSILIVTRTGVGKLAIAPFDLAISQDITGVVLDTDRVHPEYFFWALNSLVPQLKATHQGTSINGILRSDLEALALPLPPKQEQKKIAEILSTVDEAIERSESAAEKSRHLHASLVQQLVYRGIGHSRFKDTQLGKLPEDWKVLPLEKVAEVERGKFSHRPRNEPRFYGGPYPFIQTGEVTASGGRIRTYTQSLNDEGLAISRLFPKGTILMTIAANIGETAIAEFDVAFPDSLVGIVATENMDNRFLEYYLRTRKKHLNGLAPASAQKNINLETLRPYPVPLPPRKEQVAIADALDALATRNAAEQAFLIRLDSLKMALMKVLLTGIVRARQVQSI